MGKVIAFPAPPQAEGGIVHVYKLDDGRFEIGHESASGSSWGHFDTFDCPQSAAAAAYRLNRVELENSCSVYLSPSVLAALPESAPPDRGAF